MAVSPSLELRMDRLRDLNTKICNIYSEMVANSKKYMDEIFAFNATMSVRAKREAVRTARECYESNERLKIEMERAQKEARALSDSVAKLVMEEQKDFINQLFNCDVTRGR